MFLLLVGLFEQAPLFIAVIIVLFLFLLLLRGEG